MNKIKCSCSEVLSLILCFLFTGEMDVMVNSYSSIRCVRKLQFAFDDKLQDTIEDKTLKEIVDDPREYQKVSAVFVTIIS